jgi:phosphoribosyl 1,2-cyclic phosphodiesterase
MSLFITSLNSGSNGNCYYIGNETEAVLIDAGISCREIEKRIKRLGLLMKNIKAVFISHEHSDHIRGLQALIKKFQLPVYISPATLQGGRLQLEAYLVKDFEAHQAISIGDLNVTAFPKYHDASDPYSFFVTCRNICVGVFTDIGAPCQQLVKYFRQCHAAFLEANYDEEMLEKGSYPIHLKNRIRNGMGHLSNSQALDLFIRQRPEFMTHLLLAHLSQNNNSPELVQQLFNAHAQNVKITVAPRHKETEVFHICRPNNDEKRLASKFLKYSPPVQLALSFT